ncbi:hypothetical protein VNO77_30365 [Canavalia gladiata]|uniref:Uncharacterized protein n=1 Tax=Canavalia gladiata TaxID=3824 RepID=A0AAN9Q3I5_CANGL
MESAWQMKCDSPFESSTSATVSTAPSMEPRGQLKEMNANHCLYPQVTHDLRSKFVGGKQGPVYPCFLRSTTHGSGVANTGNSFRALLHGRPSLLQCDFQDLSDCKLCTSSGDCTAAIGNSVVDSIRSGTFLTSSGGLTTENLINHKLQSWANTSPEISSRAKIDLSSSNNFVFHDIQSSNAATQAMIPSGEIEKARESFSSLGQCRRTISASNLNVCCSDIQSTPHMALEQCSSMFPSPFINGYPRVFCMGKSGYLLLSNTGLLGIVCSCHCCHMSVLKFSEHSGLHGINPGDAVYMESGETISQWQKLYFSKFGKIDKFRSSVLLHGVKDSNYQATIITSDMTLDIHMTQSPGNESEWDWPEVLSATGSVMQSNAAASGTSKADLSHILSSSAVILRKQPTAVQDGCNIPLKGFPGISQNSLYDRVKSQLMESNLAMYSTAPNIVETQLDDGCQLMPPFLDSVKWKGNLSTANSPLQTTTSHMKDHECIIKKNAKDGLVGRDAASSNIELRLGQPPQTGNPVSSFIEPPRFNALAGSPKLQPLKQMVNNLCREEELQKKFSYAAGSFKVVEEQPQLKPRYCMSAVSNASGAARARFETNNVAKGVTFLQFSQFDNRSKQKLKTNENLINDGRPIMPRKLHSDCSTMQYGFTNIPWNSNGHTGRKSNNSAPGTNKYFLDNDKGVSFAKDSCSKINSGFGIGQFMEYSSSMRAVGGNDSCISVINGNIYESSLPSDTSMVSNFLLGSNNVSSLGQDNHMTPETVIPFEGISKGLPYLVSSSASNQIPTSLQPQSINMNAYLLDENMRLLALTQILELSKQQHALYFHNMNKKHGRSSNISNPQHYLYEASTSEQVPSGESLKLPQNRGTCGIPNSTDSLEKLASLTGKHNAFLFPLLLTVFLESCCLSGLAPIPLHSKEKESQCKHTYDVQNDEPSLRRSTMKISGCFKFSGEATSAIGLIYGLAPLLTVIAQYCTTYNLPYLHPSFWTKPNTFLASPLTFDLSSPESGLHILGISKDNTRSRACEKCSEQPSDIHLGGKYTGAAWVNCCRNNFFSGIESFHYILKQQFANAYGETSLKIASDLCGDLNTSKDHFEQCGKLDGQDSIKIGSHTPQWRDVPNKVRKAVCDATSLDQTATGSDWEGLDGVQHGNDSAKRFKRTIDMEDIWKEQENSNVSSGSSAPVVTQASVEVNKVDSCTIDAVHTGFANNLVVDEGSGIDQGWSSDVAGSERSADFLSSTCGNYLKNGYLRVLDDQPCRSLLDELKLLDSLIWKKGRDQNNFVLSADCKTNQSHTIKKGVKGKKRKRNELRILDASLSSRIPSLLNKKNDEGTGIPSCSSSLSKEMQMHFLSSLQRSSSNKERCSAFSSKFLSCKNHLNKHDTDKVSYESESNSDTEFHTLPEVSGTKKLRKDFTSDCFELFQMQEPAYEEPENVKLKPFSCRKENANRITRPVVCGKYGEISNGQAREVPLKAKIVSLSKVLKNSKRCMVPKIGKPRLTSKKKWKRLSIGTSSGHCCGNLGLKTKEDNETQNTIICNEINVDVSMEGLERCGKLSVIYQGKKYTPLKTKNKEIRKQRSINELTAKETKVKDMLNCAEDREHGFCYTKCGNSIQDHTSASIINSDVFCCVCQSSSNDEINCLLECSRCLIRVHQACYGISTLPRKGHWCCRPCRTNSKNIACVLCGYGGGAMTRAILSRTIVKSLLKVWNVEKDGMPKHTTSCGVFEKEVHAFQSSKSGLEIDRECVSQPKNVDTSTTDLLKFQMSTDHKQHTLFAVSNFKVHNSITAGALNPSVKQWVHMVCGLWTPGTRCPNVDTMSAFDVSGVSRPRADMVCSICNRWGGSCIECRIADCSVKFHPWCAHQKNLLQCETEGIDGEKIGFYGRCVLHVDPRCPPTYNPIDEMGSQEEKDLTCARAEGYKGRRWDGFQNNHYSALKANGGCLVPEEQLNAWIHINGQKLCSQGLPKFPNLDIEHDCRKEYVRYKQTKGWKHLVVYKSRIHALGLYTSRFISRGEMVVEYVGEIVGLRVADKRENEYQSGRKLQYKSACYFFRIDKEHIIDATRKGGIARFVNHSCLPNCAAKVITVKHEKKVVFFAERDIFPGEEITYDYHFNHEDEGKKIPCYCNSRNCRRYMN